MVSLKRKLHPINEIIFIFLLTTPPPGSIYSPFVSEKHKIKLVWPYSVFEHLHWTMYNVLTDNMNPYVSKCTYCLLSLVLQHSHGTCGSRPSREPSSRVLTGLTAGSAAATKKNSLQRGRYGSNLLYSSSEDDEDHQLSDTTITPLPPPPPSTTASRSSSLQATFHRSRSPLDGTNPFENFTVGKNDARPHSIRTSEVSERQSRNRLPVSATVAISGSSGRFNPLGQVESHASSALIPDKEEERGYGGTGDNERDCPLIDDWLVDDMSLLQQPPAKRKKYQSSLGTSTKEIRSFLEGTSSKAASGGGKRKRPLQRRHKTVSQEKWNDSSSLTDASGKSACRQSTGDEQTSKRRRASTVEVSSSDSDERFLDSVMITGEDFVESNTASTSTRHQLQASFNTSGTLSSRAPDATRSRFSSSRRPLQRSIEQQQVHRSLTTTPNSSHLVGSTSHTPTFNPFQTTPPSCMAASDTHTHSEVPPLRVRVRVESKLYLIPCPRKNRDGANTTIGWLITQASERHYAQHGVRPQLSLTTSDGAILCPSDLIAHVLSPNEEVVGVVEQWQEATLEERYLETCKKAGIGEYSLL